MSLHPSTFQYLDPTEGQKADMADVRNGFSHLLDTIDSRVPDGADKTYLVRKLRECAMWANVAITRDANGAPRANTDPSF